jgi:hypothetical protein
MRRAGLAAICTGALAAAATAPDGLADTAARPR